MTARYCTGTDSCKVKPNIQTLFYKEFTKYASQNLQRFYIMKSQNEIREVCGMKSFKTIKEYWRLAILGLAYTAVFAAAITIIIR